MNLSGRKTLALISGGTVFAATATAATFLATCTPRAALAPWDAAGSYDDPRLFALSYGLLAPNPHNRQRWRAALDGEHAFTLWRDPKRTLPVTDPFARQLTIGMGCFVELARIAAANRGFILQTTRFPEGEGGPVAHCRLREGASANPLFAHVLARRSHKSTFEDRKVTEVAARALTPHARLFLGGSDTERLRALALEAWRIEAATPAAWQESVDLLRIGKAEINASPDGIDLGGPFLETLAALGLFTRAAAADPQNPGTQNAIQETANAIAGAPAFAVQTSAGNTRVDQIGAGARWLRLNLAATGAGLALRPVSQALQEYPEMSNLRRAVHAEFTARGETVQMPGLLGYGPMTPRTPRWPLEARLQDVTP